MNGLSATSIRRCTPGPPGACSAWMRDCAAQRIFHKLMINFTGWVNRQDIEGRNVFQGGFLGLDNIGVFDRSQKLPVAGRIDQSDGTSWMAMYALHMMRISLELATCNRVYEST